MRRTFTPRIVMEKKSGLVSYTLYIGGTRISTVENPLVARLVDDAFKSAVAEMVREAVAEEAANCALVGGNHFSIFKCPEMHGRSSFLWSLRHVFGKIVGLFRPTGKA